jgi:hypothetical protein
VNKFASLGIFPMILATASCSAQPVSEKPLSQCLPLHEQVDSTSVDADFFLAAIAAVRRHVSSANVDATQPEELRELSGRGFDARAIATQSGLVPVDVCFYSGEAKINSWLSVGQRESVVRAKFVDAPSVGPVLITDLEGGNALRITFKAGRVYAIRYSAHYMD